MYNCTYLIIWIHKAAFYSYIHLGEGDRWVVGEQGGGGLFELWLQSLAVTAPAQSWTRIIALLQEKQK